MENKNSDKQKKTRKFFPWLVAFFLPFFSVGLIAGIIEYNHGLKDIGKVYTVFNKPPDELAMIGDALVFFVIFGTIAGIVGLLSFGIFRGIKSLLKQSN